MANAKKVTVMLGYVPIPTKFEVAIDSDGDNKDVHTVCTGPEDAKHDPVRVKQSVACPTCETSHSWVGRFPEKGTERDGKMVVMTNEELAGATGTPINGRDVPVTLALHNREKVYAATLPSDGVHNVLPDKGGDKAYALLRDALAGRPDVVGVAVWAPSSKNALWVFEVVDQRIVVSKRCWPEDVRVASAIAPTEYTDVEKAQFASMVDAMVTDFDLGVYVDQSRRSKAELIASKTGEAVPVGAAAPNTTAAVGDLLGAIQATLDAAKPKVVKTAKRPAAKKAPAKKVATTAKKVATTKIAATRRKEPIAS